MNNRPFDIDDLRPVDVAALIGYCEIQWCARQDSAGKKRYSALSRFEMKIDVMSMQYSIFPDEPPELPAWYALKLALEGVPIISREKDSMGSRWVEHNIEKHGFIYTDKVEFSLKSPKPEICSKFAQDMGDTGHLQVKQLSIEHIIDYLEYRKYLNGQPANVPLVPRARKYFL